MGYFCFFHLLIFMEGGAWRCQYLQTSRTKRDKIKGNRLKLCSQQFFSVFYIRPGESLQSMISFFFCHPFSVILFLSSFFCHPFSVILFLSSFFCHTCSVILFLTSFFVVLFLSCFFQHVISVILFVKCFLSQISPVMTFHDL